MLITKQNILKTGIAFVCLTMGIGILSGCSENNLQESNSESSSSVQQEVTSSISSQTNLNGSSNESKAETITENETIHLPNTTPLEFIFSSGAGAWRTSLTLNNDGSFEGKYSDSDMGDRAETYPHGTVYICEFSGQFDNIKQIDDTTYSMTLNKITTKNPEDEEWIANEIRYIASGPYGLDNGKEFLFYTPQTPVKNLTEELLHWGYGSVGLNASQETLDCYGLHNKETGYGFFSQE